MPEHSPLDSSSSVSASASSNFNFEQFFESAQQKLDTLKARRQSVQKLQHNHQMLKTRKVDEQTLQDIHTAHDIDADLEKIEYELANELIEFVGEENLTWKGTGESFWIFFRYAGIGFAIAVLLNHLIR